MIGMPSRIGYASLADREISSCFSASYSSGPFVSGQTKISRSLGSTALAGRSVDAEFMAQSTGFARNWQVVQVSGPAFKPYGDREAAWVTIVAAGRPRFGFWRGRFR